MEEEAEIFDFYNLYYNEDVSFLNNDDCRIIKEILYGIKNNVKRNTNYEICLDIYKYPKPIILYSSNVSIDNKTIEVQIVFNGILNNSKSCYYKNINPNNYFVTPFGRSFGRYGKFRNFYIYDINIPMDYLIISVNESDCEFLGQFLYQDKWRNNFSPNDKKWVLYLYSPLISRKFIEASNDLLEQRRLTYYALTNEFKDGWIQSQFENTPYNYAAKLSNNPIGEDGLTIYIYELKDNSIKLNKIQQYEPSPFKINFFYKYPDLLYPVDIFLYDGENNPSLGKVHYQYDDFNGIFTELTSIAGISTVGVGSIIGRLKGFGVLYYGYYVINESGFVTSDQVSITGGIISGSYIASGIPTPLNFSGISTSYFISKGSFTMGDWFSLNTINKKSWIGKFQSVSLSKDFFENLKISNYLPINLGYYNTRSELIFPPLSVKTKNIFYKNQKYYGY